ncbi:MAG TPA: Mg2+ and Co2+ transporter CorB [Acetivibrio clariflavus]|nr:Mg2+ and Co2+ transporter CorB [Acetivibrio clariflavus]
MDGNYKHPEYRRKVKFKTNSVGSRKENLKWVIFVTLFTFVVSSSLSIMSSTLLEDKNIFISFLIVLIIILIGIIFDIIGIAVTAAEEAPFHAMASRKMYGAKNAIKLMRNANKVSSICNDVVGDICGVISGAASGFIVIKIAATADGTVQTLASVGITGTVAALTIGGKAIGKTIAMEKSNYIVYKVAVILMFLTGRLNFIEFGKKKKIKESELKPVWVKF